MAVSTSDYFSWKTLHYQATVIFFIIFGHPDFPDCLFSSSRSTSQIFLWILRQLCQKLNFSKNFFLTFLTFRNSRKLPKRNHFVSFNQQKLFSRFMFSKIPYHFSRIAKMKWGKFWDTYCKNLTLNPNISKTKFVRTQFFWSHADKLCFS